MRTCTKCLTPKPDEEFWWKTVRGKRYRHSLCKDCHRKSKAPGYRSPARDRYIAERAAGIRVAHWIFEDVTKSDRKKGWQTDLSESEIETLIANGCAYCGETKLRMTLDRIDNSVGHVKTNIVPACIRCNYMRRDMPYAAWYALLPALRSARAQGLFGTWTGSTHVRVVELVDTPS